MSEGNPILNNPYEEARAHYVTNVVRHLHARPGQWGEHSWSFLYLEGEAELADLRNRVLEHLKA